MQPVVPVCPECGGEASPKSKSFDSAAIIGHQRPVSQCETCCSNQLSFDKFQLSLGTLRILAEMKILKPTPIQAAALSPLLQGKDVIGQAKTGSGKTLAYALPMVERCEPGQGFIEALVLVPTRELAIQVDEVIRKFAVGAGIRSVLLYGGRPPMVDHQALARGANIVVGTPGRVLDHVWQGSLRLPRLKMLVLDEGDEMLDKGFAPDVEKIISFTPQERQTVIVSATVPPWVKQVVNQHMRYPINVRVHTDTE